MTSSVAKIIIAGGDVHLKMGATMFRMSSPVLWGALLLTTAGAASATPIQYNINISGGDLSMTGIITTDGNLGNLVPSDFLGWDLVVKNGADTFELTGVNSFIHWFNFNNGYEPISATSAGLFEDFKSADGSGNESGVVFGANDNSIDFDAYVLGPDSPNTGYTLYYGATGNTPVAFIHEPEVLQDIGTAVTATPLPGALPMFAGGAGVLGFLGWRRKMKSIAPAA